MVTLPVILVIVWLSLALIAMALSYKISTKGLLMNLLTIAGSLAMFVVFMLLGWTTVVTVLASLSIVGAIFGIVSLIKIKSMLNSLK